jgi:hypothetical protein
VADRRRFRGNASAAGEGTTTRPRDHGHYRVRGTGPQLWDYLSHVPYQPVTRMTSFRAVPVPGAEGAPAPGAEGKGTGRELPADGNSNYPLASEVLSHPQPETRTTDNPSLAETRATTVHPHPPAPLNH